MEGGNPFHLFLVLVEASLRGVSGNEYERHHRVTSLQFTHMDVAIIKYNAGNVRSVLFALERIGVEAVVTDDFDAIRRADRVIFPGVGEASSAMAYLRERKLDRLICSQTVSLRCDTVQSSPNRVEQHRPFAIRLVPRHPRGGVHVLRARLLRGKRLAHDSAD